MVIAANVPDSWLFLSTWLAGGVLAFCGAMVYAELAALRPRAGGEYVYLREAYGPLVGFLTGWTSFVAGFAGAMAASAMLLPLYLERFIPGGVELDAVLQIPLPYVRDHVLERRPSSAIAAVWLFAFVHIRGVGPGPPRQQRADHPQGGALLIFIALGLTIGAGRRRTCSRLPER